MSKIVIIGNGHVGSHCAFTLAMQSLCTEIVLIDTDPGKNMANTFDTADAAVLFPAHVTIRAGGYEDCADAEIIIVSIGQPRKPGQTRLDMLESSVKLLSSVTENLNKAGTKGIVITITNPADVIADQVRKELSLPRQRVFSTGTALDTARLKRTMGEFFDLDPKSISVFCIGEHGDSSTAAFSCAAVGGRFWEDVIADQPAKYADQLTAACKKNCPPDTTSVIAAAKSYFLERTHQIGMEIIDGKGSTEFGIGAVLADTVRAILFDERRVIPVSVFLNGEYEQTDVHASVPCIIGKNGIEKIVSLPLVDEEKLAFSDSCAVIRAYINRINSFGQ